MKLNLGKASLFIAICALVALAIQTGLNIQPAKEIMTEKALDIAEMGMVEKAVETGGLRISFLSFFLALIGLTLGIIGAHQGIEGAKNALLYNLALMICSFTPFYVWFL
ncbi:MAG: hypothetical protein AAF487_13990 [Bacteroidota bacterium]